MPFAPGSRPSQGSVLPVVLIYAAFAGLWIVLSDQVVEWLFGDPAQIILASTVKGSLFVLVTSLLLYGLLRQRQKLAQTASEQQSQTERLRALRLLAAIADSSEDAIFAKDLAGRYILFNRAACEFTGRQAEDVLGCDDHVLFPAEQAERLMATARQAIAEDRAITREEVLSTAGGERIFLATKAPLRDSDGTIVGSFGISRDISEYKRAEAATRESEARFRALVEQSLAGIYIIQNGRFRYVNPGFATIFGYDSAEALIDGVPFIDLVHPDDRELVAENIRRRVEGDCKDIHYSFAGLRRDGGRVGLEVHGRAFDYQGLPAVIGMILDITARQAAEAELRRQTGELAQRYAELERFNRASVGRELDMIQLKQQVNALSRELGREPPFALGFLETPDAA